MKYKIKSKILQDLEKKSWWLQNASEKGCVGKNVKILKIVDNQLEKLEQEKFDGLKKRSRNIYKNKDKEFKNKSIKKLDKKEREYERQLFSFFTEILVVKEFTDKGNKLKFNPEDQNKKTPDFFYKDGSKSFYIEVKNIRSPSDEDEALTNKGFYCSDVNHKYRIHLFQKIIHYLNEAESKFQHYGRLNKNQKTLVLNYNLGLDTICCEYGTNLDEIYGSVFWNCLENIYNTKILRRKLFL